ncbi:MAG: BamA/TamA family outer membrane protein [Deltaproteobacteria bacterium]|nr:BamA/TamA family outer membrane protein [Deltaproteobacteria bacterium]MBW2391073.1 BamA/TamA family outer membrane protein [Deltaproteobacteria bacterium]
MLLLCVGPALAEESAGSEGRAEDLGLFKSTINTDSLERGGSSLQDPPSDALSDDEAGRPDERRGEPFVAPIPFRSPTLGWGGALAGGYIFHIDPEDRGSPPSSVAIAGFASENESFGGVLTGILHIAEDLWRVTPVFNANRIHYDFYGIGSEAADRGDKIEIQADTLMGSLEVLRRLPEQVKVLSVPLFLGPSAEASHTENSVGEGGLPPGVSSSELDETRIGLGVHLQRDSRDESFFPMEGSLSDLGFKFFDSGIGSDFSYRVWDVSYRRYDELWKDGVLASRVFGRFTEGNTPFSDLSQHDLRGYESGRYQDAMHMAGEIELRQHLYKRLAGTLFTGLGQVAPAIDDFSDDRLLWSVGFGLRIRLTEQNRMNYRADAAWGRDGFEFYFSLTEAF